MISLFFDSEFLSSILLAVALLSVLAAILGTFVTYNNLNYLSSSLTHASLGGIGLAVFLGFSLVWSAQLFALILGGAVVYYFHHNKYRLGSFLDLIYAFGMSLGAFFVTISPGYQKDFSNFLFGSLILLDQNELILLAVFTLVVVVYVSWNYKKLLAVSFDPEYASTCGINVKRQNVGLILLLAFALPLMVRIIGITATIALISVAPMVFERWVISVARIIFYSAWLNMVIFLIALYLSYNFDWPVGSVTSLVAVGLFIFLRLFFKLKELLGRNFTFYF